MVWKFTVCCTAGGVRYTYKMYRQALETMHTIEDVTEATIAPFLSPETQAVSCGRLQPVF